MSCTLCESSESTRFIPLYVIGSEGMEVCHTCEMKIVEFCRNLQSENAQKRKAKWMAKKKEDGYVS